VRAARCACAKADLKSAKDKSAYIEKRGLDAFAKLPHGAVMGH
jgi:hypothetical protein